jgi:hypothetical protein
VPYAGATTAQPLAMAAELRRATFAWHPERSPLDKCAQINLDVAQPPSVELFLSTCRDELLRLDVPAGKLAVMTLVHESVHRFGYGTSDADEDFASKVGVVVFNVWAAQRAAAHEAWTDLAREGAPTPRFDATAVWTGAGDDAAVRNQLLVWGGCGALVPGTAACNGYPDRGGRLTFTPVGALGEAPRTAWRALGATADAAVPIGRRLHTAVWTGDTKWAPLRDKMLIFGGCRGDDTACDQSFAVTACADGACDDARKNKALYDARTDTWSDVTPDGAPTPRVMHSAVWTTDDEMIVWGGLEGYQSPAADRALGDGAVLRFSEEAPQGQWTALPRTPRTPSPRFGHTAVWTGTEMLVWGGCARTSASPNRCGEPVMDGAFYDPAAARKGREPWRTVPAPSFLVPRARASAAWTGRYLIVWGGEAGGAIMSDGAIYDDQHPENGWAPMAGTLPEHEGGRRDHSAAFEPLRGRMIVWGGASDPALSQLPSSTLIYELGEHPRWTRAATSGDPVGRLGAVATWIRDALVVWGGYSRASGVSAAGGVFNP